MAAVQLSHEDISNGNVNLYSDKSVQKKVPGLTMPAPGTHALDHEETGKDQPGQLSGAHPLDHEKTGKDRPGQLSGAHPLDHEETGKDQSAQLSGIDQPGQLSGSFHQDTSPCAQKDTSPSKASVLNVEHQGDALPSQGQKEETSINGTQKGSNANPVSEIVQDGNTNVKTITEETSPDSAQTEETPTEKTDTVVDLPVKAESITIGAQGGDLADGISQSSVCLSGKHSDPATGDFTLSLSSSQYPTQGFVNPALDLDESPVRRIVIEPYEYGVPPGSPPPVYMPPTPRGSEDCHSEDSGSVPGGGVLFDEMDESEVGDFLDNLSLSDLRDPEDCCDPCMGCCGCILKYRLNKVSPEERTKSLRLHFDQNKSPEFAPQEGRRLFFSDGIRRIDYVLAWKFSEKESSSKQNRAQMREVFERNLEEEGLDIESDFREGREIQYVKIHAPWEVLTRYAEIMKTRMPIKEVPEEIRTASLWEAITDYISVLFSPFALDPVKVPPLPKKFTYTYEREKDYLFAIPQDKELFFSHAQRSRTVDYILRRKRYSANTADTFAFGIKRLLKNEIYSGAYPLHEGSWKPKSRPSMRRLLYENWAYWRNFYKVQPLDYIRIYFGEKIGLYFAWLGYYTYMLILPSVVGLAVFLYGVFTLDNNIEAQETCDWSNNITMCPLCDKRCPYWNYAAVCRHVEASHLFDNGATVFFAVFMCLWGTIFLEFWKREQASIQFKWNTMTFEEEEEPPRPEYLIRMANSRYMRRHRVTGQPPRPEYLERLHYSHFRKKHRVTGVQEPFMPFWRRKVPVYVASASVMLFLVAVAIACIIGVYVYRMASLTVLYARSEALLYKNASMVTAATAACINLVVILVLSYVYTLVAHKLTDWECLRTQSEYDSSLTFKLYILQFVNYYASIFYIAFIKGRFTGRPGDYNTIFGARQEECSGGGCLMELCIQLIIIFVGKQLIQNTLLEILIPRVKRWIKKCRGKKETLEALKLKPWEKDYTLEELGPQGLFNEYLEMMIQFGFVTIFVAAFPLAPLFALLNNILEIRIDSNKFITQLRRPMATRAATIGVWYEVMFGVSRLAILSNAFIIAFTTGFIHRQVYLIGYSSDHSLSGYVEQSMSFFNVSDFKEGSAPVDEEGRFNSVQICRYRDYREPPWAEQPYVFTAQFWHVLAAQFIFVVTFENLVIVITNFVAYIIPDMPRKLREQVHRESYLTNEIILKTELEKAHGMDGKLSPGEMDDIRKRAKADISAHPPSSEGLRHRAGTGEDIPDHADGDGKPGDEADSEV